MEILASLREKGASRVRVRRCPKWTTSSTPVGLPAHAAFAGRIEKCRADCRQNHQEAFPGDGDVALLCYPTSISPSSTRDPESAEAGRGTRFLCVSRSRSRDRSHYCCGRSGGVSPWGPSTPAPPWRSRRLRSRPPLAQGEGVLGAGDGAGKPVIAAGERPVHGLIAPVRNSTICGDTPTPARVLSTTCLARNRRRQ
jgi:hypothetical protein